MEIYYACLVRWDLFVHLIAKINSKLPKDRSIFVLDNMVRTLGSMSTRLRLMVLSLVVTIVVAASAGYLVAKFQTQQADEAYWADQAAVYLVEYLVMMKALKKAESSDAIKIAVARAEINAEMLMRFRHLANEKHQLRLRQLVACDYADFRSKNPVLFGVPSYPPVSG